MLIENPLPKIDNILADWKEACGPEYESYRNHACRVINYCFALKDCNEGERNKIIVAAAFHDLGIWIDESPDYFSASVSKAKEYLRSRGLRAWNEEIKLMITEHHRTREYKNDAYPLVELFRKGDLVDCSLGMVRFGLAENFIKDVNTAFPSSEFSPSPANKESRWRRAHALNSSGLQKP